MEKNALSPTESVRNQYFAAIVVNIACFCHGCSTGWMSPSLPLLKGPESPLAAPLTDTESNIIAAMTCVTGTIFTPIFGWIGDRFGRKKGLVMTGFPYLLCWIIKLTWYSPTGLIIARLLIGIGGAGVFVLAPMYCVEIGSLQVKGALGSMTILSINMGIVLMYILGAYISYATVIALMIPQHIIFITLMMYLPETPSFLMKKGKIEDVKKSLSWLRNIPLNSDIVKREIEILKHSNLETLQLSPWDAFKSSPPTKKAFATLVTLFTFQALMGHFAIISYAEEIFNQAGTNISSSMCSIILGFLLLAGSFVASSLIERLGRKILLSVSCFVFATSMMTMSAFLFVQNHNIDVEAYRVIPVVALSVALFTYSAGAGPITYILPSEIFILQVRSAASSFNLTLSWFLSFVLVLGFGPAVAVLGMSNVFFIFGMTTIGLVILAVFFIPETKGKTVDECMAYFDKTKKGSRSLLK